MPIRLSLAVTAAALMGSLLAAAPAAASCPAHPTLRTGMYVNVDRNARTVTRLELDRLCGGSVRHLGGGDFWVNRGGHAAWRAQFWGSCSGRECDWGRERVSETSNGQRLTGRIDRGFVSRTVAIAPDGNGLRVVITSIYNDGRPAQVWNETFRRR